MPPYEPLRVAIVGCGNISGGYAKSLETKPEKVTILGATDVDPERTRAFVQTHGGASYPDLGAVLADPNVEAIINLTIHHAHAEVTCAALQAGKHVHSEKPLAGTLSEGRRCVELAERPGLRLSCSPFTFMGEALLIVWLFKLAIRGSRSPESHRTVSETPVSASQAVAS